MAERATHTPGELTAVGAEVRAASRRVADCDNHVPYVRDAEGEANAREIARRWNAFPDLLAACELMLSSIDGSYAQVMVAAGRMRAAVDRAIAAEGGFP